MYKVYKFVLFLYTDVYKYKLSTDIMQNYCL